MCKLFVKLIGLFVSNLVGGLILTGVSQNLTVFIPLNNIQGKNENPYTSIVADFLQGGNPYIDTNKWDRELFNQTYASQVQDAPDLAVFGTSHVSLIQQSSFDKLRVFNHFVAGSELGSIEKIYLAYTNNRLPKKILIGIDFWYLQEASTSVPYWFDSGMRSLNIKETGEIIQRMSRSVIRNYLEQPQKALRNFIQTLFPQLFQGPKYPKALISMIQLSETLNRDGSGVVPPNMRTKPLDVSSFKSSLILTEKLLDRPLSYRQVQRFEKIIKQMLSDGISIGFILTPLHPAAFDFFADDPVLKMTSLYYAKIAKDYNIPMVGSYNPADCVFLDQDFIDDNHLTSISIHKLINGANCKSKDWDMFLSP